METTQTYAQGPWKTVTLYKTRWARGTESEAKVTQDTSQKKPRGH